MHSGYIVASRIVDQAHALGIYQRRVSHQDLVVAVALADPDLIRHLRFPRNRLFRAVQLETEPVLPSGGYLIDGHHAAPVIFESEQDRGVVLGVYRHVLVVFGL